MGKLYTEIGIIAAVIGISAACIIVHRKWIKAFRDDAVVTIDMKYEPKEL